MTAWVGSDEPHWAEDLGWRDGAWGWGQQRGSGGVTSREEGWVFLAEGPAKALGWQSLRCVGESGLAMACGVVRPRKGPESCHVIQVCHWS